MKPDLRRTQYSAIMLYAQRNQAPSMASHRTDSSAITALPPAGHGEALGGAGGDSGTDTDTGSQTRADRLQRAGNRLPCSRLCASTRIAGARRSPAHWQVNMMLCTLYPSRCAAMHAERMPKTEAAWRSIYSKILT